MIYAFLITCLIFSFIERRRTNKLAIWVYAGINLLHTTLPTFDNGLVYYGGCALTDLIVITFLSLIHCRLSKILIVISLFSILINIGGFVLWLTYRPLDVYNIIMAILYGLAMLMVFIAGKGDDRSGTYRHSNNRLCSDTGSSGHTVNSRTEEKE